jgi:5-formyltetrahydrofolate cyclo-ligase
MAAHLADWINRQAIRRLGLFYPSQILQEISPLSLLHQLTLKPTYYLPRMEASRQLSFHEWSGHPSDLELSRHHLYQPTAKTPTTPPHTLDILLVPLVAFDRHGYRIGMGGGFYDKTLQHTHPRPRLIGCGYAFQEIDLFPHDPWDIPCDLIFTEHGCFTPA